MRAAPAALLLALAVVILTAGCSTPPATSPDEFPDDVYGNSNALPLISIGDPAPMVVVSEWVRGEALPGFELPSALGVLSPRSGVRFEPGMVYLVDFWATWCSPCLASMGRTSALQERFPDSLVVLAVTSLDDANTRRAVYREAINRERSMRFRVAIDDGNQTTRAYRHASRETALPRSFVVDGEGRLAWIGHPADADPVVSAVIDGRWDIMESRRSREALIDARARADAALEELQRADALDDGLARLAALEVLAALPPEAAPIAPVHWALCERLRQMDRIGRHADARIELERAVENATGEADIEMLAGLASVALEVDADRAQSIALTTERLAGQRSARWAANAAKNEWEAYMRSATAVQWTETFTELAAVHRTQGRLEDAVRLQTRAVDCAQGLPEQLMAPLQTQLDGDRAALRDER